MSFLKMKHRMKVTYAIGAMAAAFLAVLFVPSFPGYQSTGENLYTVWLNDTEIGTVADPSDAETIVAEVRRDLAEESEELLFIPAKLTCEGKEVIFGRVDDAHTLKQRVREEMENGILQTLQHAYTIKINQYTVNLGSSEEVTALLQSTLDRYDTEQEFQVKLIMDPDRELNVLTTEVKHRDEKEVEQWKYAGVEGFFAEEFGEIQAAPSGFDQLEYGLCDLDFADTVEIVETYLMPEEISTLEEAIAEVTRDQETEEIYEVQPGDTLSQISEESGIPMEELVAINPTLENENSMIRAGDELIITVPEPELSVYRTEQIYSEENYDLDTVYIDNDEWYTTESVVRQQPSAGHRKAASIVTYRNDRELSREVVFEEVDYEAVPKIVERGTKVPPTFIKPISGGRLTSNYGGRKAPMKGASTNHQGTDWATPVGTAVVASSGGTVTKAGWGNGYGYVVYIQHPDGRETRYGHLSKILVRAGQKVSQGEKIALSGNTGRSTGPHLHFELRINGSAVNSLAYLN